VTALEVIVIADMVDWSKYKIGIVMLKYDDETHNIHQTRNFSFNKVNCNDQTWRVLLQDASKKGYQYRLRLIAQNPADNLEGDWKSTEDPVLVVQ
jgi:hypothetical protein